MNCVTIAEKVTIYRGEALATLRSLPDAFVDE